MTIHVKQEPTLPPLPTHHHHHHTLQHDHIDPVKLNAPINDLADKWKLIPLYLQSKGIVRQHIDSYNYFISHDIHNILTSNHRVTCDTHDQFYLQYNRIYIGHPTIEEDITSTTTVTPQQCRTRDLTYSAPIYVDLEYTRAQQLIRRKKVCVGRMPVMLRSNICVLHNKPAADVMAMHECIYDTGGYFIVRGAERVILIQEQLSKNRIIVECDSKGIIQATVTSSTHERKSKTHVSYRNKKLFVSHNSFTEDLPLCVVLRAMQAYDTDMAVMQCIGVEYADMLAGSLAECLLHNVFTATQALEYIGTRIKATSKGYTADSSAATPTNTNTAQQTAANNFGRGSTGVARKTKGDVARDVLAGMVLSHISAINYDFTQKSIYLCVMARRVLQCVNNSALLDDKDYYGNKRLELAGQLLSLLFEDLFKRLNGELKRQAEQALSKANRAAVFDIVRNIRQDTISNGLSNAISTGNWNIKRFRMERVGVTQVLSRLSFISALGMMTRITSQFEKTRKVSGPRSLQGSQWGMLCPSDTPEGESCGLVKNLALLTHVTTDDDEIPICQWCLNLGVEDIEAMAGQEMANNTNVQLTAGTDDKHSKPRPSNYMVILNGRILGMHTQPAAFVTKFRRLRRQGHIPPFVSVYTNHTHRTVYIASDSGRVCRPLIILHNGRSLVTNQHLAQLVSNSRTFDSFLADGLIEYLDVNEENDTFVALHTPEISRQHTHLEIDPMSILGIVTGLIPYPMNNQSPRNTYQCAMGKQAIGTIGYNQYNRIDTLMYLLNYPQQPLVKSRVIEMIGFDRVPAGQNAIVAVMSYTGYDIEDASILNRASLDRGFGRCAVLKKSVTQIKRYPNQTVDRIVAPPDQTPHPKTGIVSAQPRFRSLDADGIVSVGSRVNSGEVIVNKQTPINTQDNLSNVTQLSDAMYKPFPLTYRGPDYAYVDKVALTSSDSEHFIIKVLMRSSRRPELGDKFSSRHGQKGVCGLIVQQADMPFNQYGVAPDLVMNPHGFPSRMTVGKMMELVAGKAAVHTGQLKYGSAFAGDSVEQCSRELIANGYSYSGKDVLTSGITGETIGAYIFHGPVYYQKLKHMVLDKLHARSRGPRAVLTRQPTEGRAREGGLRLGEMERDCLIGYGASNLLVERLLISSDQLNCQVCRECGLIGYDNWCQYCKTMSNMANLKIPYAAKLLFQELQAMNIMPKLKLAAY